MTKRTAAKLAASKASSPSSKSPSLSPLPVKREVKEEETDRTPARKSRKVQHDSSAPTQVKREGSPLAKIEPSPAKSIAQSPKTLQQRKAAAFQKFASTSPFPTFPRPTPAECLLARQILESVHGAKQRPKEVKASANRAGCGDSPMVLDALVRTILSQNTSDGNASRAKRSMDEAYGRSDDWEAIVKGGEARLEEAIRCGGLSKVKSKVIVRILEQTKEKYGSYTLDHLQSASADEAMAELLSFDGVGPKTASCVLLFSLGKEDFAVDTHVHRITGLIGWHPAKSSREQTYHHLNKKIPDEHKYALHVLFVSHGKRCDECKAGGRSSGKCELRQAFRQKVIEGKDEVVKDIPEDVKDLVKMEEEEDPKSGVKEEKTDVEDQKPDVKDEKREI
jgi:endonuclease-3